MTIGMTSSLQGMQRAETQLNQVAQNIAQSPSTSAGPEGDTVDLSAQAVGGERDLQALDRGFGFGSGGGGRRGGRGGARGGGRGWMCLDDGVQCCGEGGKGTPQGCCRGS